MCIRDSSPAKHESVGSVQLAVVTGSSITFQTAGYTITGPAGYMTSGTIGSGAQSNLSILIGQIPAGNGYTVTLSGSTSDMTSCRGSAPFNISALATTMVSVHLICHEAPRSTGSVSVHNTINICPVIDSINASPATAVVGGTIALGSTAHDSDTGPSALAYQWTSSSGMVAAPAAANATFTCASAGSVTITLTVSDGDPTTGCPAVMTVPVTCTAM